jgi:hypothetical protein
MAAPLGGAAGDLGAPNINVKNVDYGPLGRCYRRIWERPPSMLKMLMAAPWQVESASRPPCGFWRIDDQQFDI